MFKKLTLDRHVLRLELNRQRQRNLRHQCDTEGRNLRQQCDPAGTCTCATDEMRPCNTGRLKLLQIKLKIVESNYKVE